MPCRSDYLEPNDREKESKLVARLLVYLYGELNESLPPAVHSASVAIYGSESRVDEFTAMLCDRVKNLTAKQQQAILYDGRKKKARELANWYDAHKQADNRRLAAERLTKRRNKLRQQALAKLTTAEKRALGF